MARHECDLTHIDHRSPGVAIWAYAFRNRSMEPASSLLRLSVVGQEPRAPDTIELSGAQASPSGRRAPELRG